MNFDQNIHETLSATDERSPRTTLRRSRISNINTDASPTARRSLCLRQKSGESSSPMTKRLPHRTNIGVIGSMSSRTSHNQSNATRNSTDIASSVDQHTATTTNVDNSKNSHDDFTENISNQNSATDVNQPAPVMMNISSDDDSPVNEPSTHSRSMRSIILEYFSEEEKGYRCKLCKEIYKASRMSDSNLRLHLGTVHGLQHLLFPSQRKLAPSQNQVLSNERRAELNRAAINCIINDALPFGAFRRRGMREFLSTAVPGYVGPDRRTLQRHMSLIYKKHRTMLRKVLAVTPWIALTADTWMNCRRRRFICLTGHFFTKSFEHISLVLGFRRIFGRSVATTLRSYIDYEIRRLKIPSHKIISITTDGGSDIRKVTATGQFGQPVLCLAHILHLIVTKGLCIWKKPASEKFPLVEAMDDLWIDDDSPSSDDEIEIMAGDGVNNEEQSENDQWSEVDTDLSLDGDVESDNDLDSTDGSVATDDNDLMDILIKCHNILAKIRSTVKFIRNNSLIHSYVRIQRSMAANNISSCEKEIVLDLRIRWNSSYRMLDRFLSHKDIVKSIVSSPEKVDGITKDQMSRLKTFVFTHEEWDLVYHLHQVLEPFVIATKVLSGRRYATIGLSMLVCRNLASFIQPYSTDDEILSCLKKSLSFQFNYYLNGKVEENQKQYMKMAAFLEPNVYCRLTEGKKRFARKMIMEKLKSMEFSSTNTSLLQLSNEQHTTNNNISTISNTNASSTSHCLILDQLALLCGCSTTTTTATVSSQTFMRIPTHDEELSLYVAQAKQGGDFKTFWKKHNDQLPRLSQLTRRYCLIPASSVVSEAAFSRAGYIQRKQRSSLCPKALQQSMLLQDRQLVERLESSLS